MTNKVYAAIAVGLLFASEVPMAVGNYDTERVAQDFDAMMCVANYRNFCVVQVCLVSERRDCQDLCLQGAVAKCQMQNNF